MRKVSAVLVMVVALVACQKPQPQRPLFRGEIAVDTTAVQLITLNQQMAEQADVRLANIVGEDYVRMDENYWVRGLYERTDEATLHEEEYIDLNAEFYTLTGELLTTHQASVPVGKVDEIQAIVQLLPQMQRGQCVTILSPWYMAFGSTGNAEVPPYENIRVELCVK